jgi:hypothetical protein
MKAAQIPKPGADFEIVEREIPKQGAGQVRIKVQACGICHSDVLTGSDHFQVGGAAVLSAGYSCPQATAGLFRSGSGRARKGSFPWGREMRYLSCPAAL